MSKVALNALLLHTPENICYLSGFHINGFFAYHALVVPAAGDPVLVVRDVEVPAAIETSWVPRRSYVDTEEPVDTTVTVLESLDLAGAKVGVENNSWFLTIERFNRLRHTAPQVSFIKEPHIVELLRTIKSPLEIECIRKAASIVDTAMAAGVNAIVPGATERDLATAIATAQIRAGGEAPLVGIIMSGERTNQIHGSWTNRQLMRGDLIYYELGGIFQQYWARLMRTSVLGRPTAEQERIAEIVISAQDEGIKKMHPGIVAAEVDEACRGPILRAKLRDSYHNRVGYSVGLIHTPSGGEFVREFMPGSKWILEAGMVFHMLLMARGIGFSETILVTEKGPEVLTKFERKLISC
jgi:Xaa-Pro dipeptidase